MFVQSCIVYRFSSSLSIVIFISDSDDVFKAQKTIYSRTYGQEILTLELINLTTVPKTTK